MNEKTYTIEVHETEDLYEIHIMTIEQPDEDQPDQITATSCITLRKDCSPYSEAGKILAALAEHLNYPYSVDSSHFEEDENDEKL